MLTSLSLVGSFGQRSASRWLPCGWSSPMWKVSARSAQRRSWSSHRTPRFFYNTVGSAFGFTEDERRLFGNWAAGSSMPRHYDATVCGEQLVRRNELLGLLREGWVPPLAGRPGIPRSPAGTPAVPRTPNRGGMETPSSSSASSKSGAEIKSDQVSKLSSAAMRGCLRAHKSGMGDLTWHVAKSPSSQYAVCGFQLPRCVYSRPRHGMQPGIFPVWALLFRQASGSDVHVPGH